MRTKLSGLHYLRALATILVVVVHAVETASYTKYFGRGFLTSFFSHGAGEIDFFFAMSGFLMVWTTTDHKAGAPRMTALEFLKKRAVRILPMLWLSPLLFDTVYFARFHSVDYGATLRAVTIWPVGTVVPGVVWTIKFEILFYFIFSILFLWIPKYKALIWVWVASPLVMAIVTNGKDYNNTWIGFAIDPVNIDFGIGIAACLIVRRLDIHIKISTQALMLAIFCMTLRLYCNYFDLRPDTLKLVLMAGVFIFAILASAVLTEEQSEFPLLVLIGDASYSIFLVHQTVVSPVLVALKRIAPHLETDVGALLAVSLAISFGIIVHITVEKPLTNWLTGKLVRKPHPARLAKAPSLGSHFGQ